MDLVRAVRAAHNRHFVRSAVNRPDAGEPVGFQYDIPIGARR